MVIDHKELVLYSRYLLPIKDFTLVRSAVFRIICAPTGNYLMRPRFALAFLQANAIYEFAPYSASEAYPTDFNPTTLLKTYPDLHTFSTEMGIVFCERVDFDYLVLNTTFTTPDTQRFREIATYVLMQNKKDVQYASDLN